VHQKSCQGQSVDELPQFARRFFPPFCRFRLVGLVWWRAKSVCEAETKCRRRNKRVARKWDGAKCMQATVPFSIRSPRDSPIQFPATKKWAFESLQQSRSTTPVIIISKSSSKFFLLDRECGPKLQFLARIALAAIEQIMPKLHYCC
jgi:hypothetical protein